MTLTFPEQPLDPTPLPWVLLQVNGRSYLIGRRERLPAVLATVALPADARRIFSSVHAHEPMLAALRMIKAKLYSDGGYAGVTGLRAQFNHREFLQIMHALAFAESGVRP